MQLGKLALCGGLILLASAMDLPAAGNRPPDGGSGRGAPPEAIEACQGKKVSDSCSMTSRRDNKTVKGQCISTPDKKLACLPEGAPKPKG
ncbi:MAG: hypothetical protein D6720_13225 [Gammaproteobacteria bacterium]|nr:MAG: hypothetical protein D6720_13225 [Gammaproteobacteria bacterium]